MQSFLWRGLLLAACSTNVLLLPAFPGHVTVRAAEEEPGPGPRETFRHAIELFREGRLAEARLPFAQAASEYPVLRDHALRHLAKLTDGLDGPKEGAAFWSTLRDEFPDSIWRGEAAFALARIERRQGNADAAISLGRESLDRIRKEDPLRPAVLWFLARILREKGAPERARRLERELRTTHPESEPAAKARALAWSLRKKEALADASAAETEIRLRLREGEARRALELCDAALERFSGNSGAAPLYGLRASALEHTTGKDAALDWLRELRQRFPDDDTGAQALFREAQILWNRNDDDAARKLFDRFVRRHPGRSEVPEARYAAARTKESAGDCREAVRRYEQLAARHPSHPLAEEARWHAGWCEYRSERFEEAARRFRELARRGGDRTASAVFWQARSLERLGRDATALDRRLFEEFPDSVYASFVERHQGRPVASVLRPRLQRTTATTPSLPSGDPHVRRFRELRALDLPDLARRELEHWTSRTGALDGDELDGALDAWAAVNGYSRAIRTAANAGACRTESPRLPHCYPRGYWSIVRRYSRKNGLDPYLVSSLIRQESLFDPQAVSWANAHGLMQVLPSTARRIAREAGVLSVDIRDLHDAETNVRLGTTYLRMLLERYDGNLPRALAAYNAGEGAADDWIRRFPEASDHEFVELVTYRETRNYVKKVLRNLRFYRALYVHPRTVEGERTDTSG